MKKSFVFGLPRSRTAWLAEYLGFMHEALYYYPDYGRFMNSPMLGDSTTCYMMVKDYVKGYPAVFIHRPVSEVADSLYKLFGWYPDVLEEWDDELRAGDGLHIDFHDLNDSLGAICKHLNVPRETRNDNMVNYNIQNTRMIKELQKCLSV